MIMYNQPTHLIGPIFFEEKFHYHKLHKAIVSRSVVATLAAESTVIWGARGTSARQKGTTPYQRPGLKVLLKDYEELSEPVPLKFIRANESPIRQSRENLEVRYELGWDVISHRYSGLPQGYPPPP